MPWVEENHEVARMSERMTRLSGVVSVWVTWNEVHPGRRMMHRDRSIVRFIDGLVFDCVDERFHYAIANRWKGEQPDS